MKLPRFFSALSGRTLGSDQEKKISELFHFRPKNPALYRRAFRHKSKYPEPGENNERPEFLGDAVYDLIVAEYLYNLMPAGSEGELTRLKSYLVSRKFLNSVAEKTGITRLVEAKIRGKKTATSIGGNALEAIVAAIYVEKGFEFAQSAVIRFIIEPYAEVNALTSVHFDPKSKLLELAQQKGMTAEFNTDEGDAVNFESSLLIDGEEVARGTGKSKKEAEKAAGAKALKNFFNNIT